MIGGVAYRDSEVADRVRTAVTERAPPESCQDVAKALEAAGFSARGLGVEKKKRDNERIPDSEPKQVRGAKERKFTTEADRNHPFAHGWYPVVCWVWRVLWRFSNAFDAPRIGRGGAWERRSGVGSGDWVVGLGAALQPLACGACCRAAFPQPQAQPAAVGRGLAGCSGWCGSPFRRRLALAAHARRSVLRGVRVGGERSSVSVGSLRRGSRVADSRYGRATGKKV